MASQPAPETSEPKKKESLPRFLIKLAIIAWVLRSLIIAPFSIPSGSMLPTMLIGDYLFVEKWPYGYSRFSFPMQIPPLKDRVFGHLPERGDIVVFRPPGHEGEDWVKRVIGLPGDRIAVSGGQVTLNGKPIPHVALPPVRLAVTPNMPCKAMDGMLPTVETGADGTVCVTPAFRETLPNGKSFTTLNAMDNGPGDEMAEVVVPQGYLFLMGDNRDDSLDSRFPVAIGGIGFVPFDHLVGRATIRFWSTDGSASWVNPISWFTALRAKRLGGSYNG